MASRHFDEKTFDEKVDDRGLAAQVTACFHKDPDYDEALVRSFDFFSQINIQSGNALIVGFCRVNLLLAAGLGIPELTRLCSQRWTEAKSKLGSR